MKCKNYKELIKEFIAGDVSTSDLERLKAHLDVCDDCCNEFSQFEEINQAFDLLPELIMNGESNLFRNDNLAHESQKEVKEPHFSGISGKILIPAGIAASVILFLSGFFTGRIQKQNHIKDQEIAALRTEVMETKNLMILSLLKQQSASKRIQAANYAEKMDELKPEVMDALLNSLNTDYSVNVRLASLEALSKYSDNLFIRSELLKTFEKESDPVLQVNMINLMVLLNEKTSAPIMQKLINDDNTQVSVKEQARKGLNILL